MAIHGGDLLYHLFLLQSKKPKPAMSTHPSSKNIDSTSLAKKKLSFSTGSGKKLTKKNQTYKRKKSVAVSVTENVNGLHDLDDTSATTTTTTTTTTTNSFVSGQVETPSTVRFSHSAAEKNAEHKRALVEMKRLEKKRLEEERLLREKENLQLQELLDKQRQEQLQHQEKTNANNIDDFLRIPKIKYPYVTPGQVSGLAELERRRVSEEGLELSAADEALSEKTAQRDQEVDVMLQRAKEAEATFLAELKEHERLQRIKKVSE